LYSDQEIEEDIDKNIIDNKGTTNTTSNDKQAVNISDEEENEGSDDDSANM
jgi:hypothetical protein